MTKKSLLISVIILIINVSIIKIVVKFFNININDNLLVILFTICFVVFNLFYYKSKKL